MMRILLSIILTFAVAFSAKAQIKYSTTNKKAIALFEQAMEAPRKNQERGSLPNYSAGIELLKKAIDKDPNFWEAYLLAGEFSEHSRKYDDAIRYYEEVLKRNPNHSAFNSTHFYLGSLKYQKGDYKGAKELLEVYVRNRNIDQNSLMAANKLIKSCEFAIKSMENAYKYEPRNLGPGVNTKDPEYFPTITVDGKTLLFTRRIYDPRVPKREGQYENLMQMQEDFFVSQLDENNVWTKAVSMPPNINTVNNEGAPTLGPDGRTLIFVGCPDATGRNYGEGRTGWGSCDFFITKRLGQKWSNPVNLPGKVNTSAWESQPSLSSDGKTMYFIRGVIDANGNRNGDIFMSTMNEDGTWNAAVRLPNNINTPYSEESVQIHPDGKTLYFASRGHLGLGGSDLFMSKMDANGVWGNPVNLGYPINTAYDENSLLVSADGEIAFFASDREGGYGDLDIYSFEMPEHLKPTKTTYFEGIVYDAKTKYPLAGKFHLIDVKTGKEVVRSVADVLTGEFLVSLPTNAEYALIVEFDGYYSYSKNFNMIVDQGMEALKMDVPMIPISASDAIVMENIFFDLNKTELLPESYVELGKLKEFMLKHPTYKIEIAGHTDTRGDAKDNMILSQGRANSVMNYLIREGIPAARLVAKGYGETQPKISDEQIAKMPLSEQEKAHRQNRRTEYKIIAR